jgi:nitrogen fixation protein NifQ
MSAEEAYQWLIGASTQSLYDAFDVHVVASILALAMNEAKSGNCGLIDGAGLEAPALHELAGAMFPDALAFFESATGEETLALDEEEQSLRDILGMFSTGSSRLERPLAAMIARRCKWPHHLWQDLGLRDRDELSRLMKRHFAGLARRNQHDMKWKKFLYRMVCGSEGFTLCTSPVCSECDDYAGCFGPEDGEARLMRPANASTNNEKAA